MMRLIQLVLAIACVGLVVYGIGQKEHWFSGDTVPPAPQATYPTNPALPAASPSGAPAQPLAGSSLVVTDPSGNAIVNTPLDGMWITGVLKSDGLHIEPGSYPGFYQEDGVAELPIAGQKPGTWIIVGHSGEQGTNEPFTSLVDLLNFSSYDGYTATLTTPLGTRQWLIRSTLDIGKFDFNGHPKYTDDRTDRVLLVACKVVNGKIVDHTVVVELVPIPS